MLCQSIFDGYLNSHISVDSLTESFSLFNGNESDSSLSSIDANVSLNSSTHQNHTQIVPHPSRPQHYLLTINEGDRVWAYPLTWTKAELLALLLMTGQQIRALNLSFTPKDPPRDVERLHELIKGLFPSMARVAAMASARAEEVAA